MKNRHYTKLGGFTNYDVVEFLIDKDADYIVSYMESNPKFFQKEYREIKIENPIICEDYETMEITADKEYLIRKEENCFDCGFGYVDVYVLVEEKSCGGNGVLELNECGDIIGCQGYAKTMFGMIHVESIHKRKFGTYDIDEMLEETFNLHPAIQYVKVYKKTPINVSYFEWYDDMKHKVKREEMDILFGLVLE